MILITQNNDVACNLIITNIRYVLVYDMVY